MKIHSSPIIILSVNQHAAGNRSTVGGEGAGRGCWAIRICNQAQSKRVNLRGVCTLATKLAPCMALVEILSVVGEVVPSRCYRAHERTREIVRRGGGRGESFGGREGGGHARRECERRTAHPLSSFPYYGVLSPLVSLRKANRESTEMPRNYARFALPHSLPTPYPLELS